MKVTLDGDAKLAQGDTEGYYTLNSMENGKQNWTQVQGSNAIWYNKENKNWMIGPKKELWTSNCRLGSTQNTIRPEEATTWMYCNDGEWLPTSNIDCCLNELKFCKFSQNPKSNRC